MSTSRPPRVFISRTTAGLAALAERVAKVLGQRGIEPIIQTERKQQQTFITEFAKDGRNTYGTFSQWDQPADPTRGLKQAIYAIQFEITVLAGKPTNLPYTSLGPLFKGRDEFLADLRQHLTAIEYAWKHADDNRAYGGGSCQSLLIQLACVVFLETWQDCVRRS